MLIQTCIATGILLGLAALGLAQEKPDFSGEWILNRRASTLSPGADAVQSGVVRIEHSDPTRRLRLIASPLDGLHEKAAALC